MNSTTLTGDKSNVVFTRTYNQRKTVEWGYEAYDNETNRTRSENRTFTVTNDIIIDSTAEWKDAADTQSNTFIHNGRLQWRFRDSFTSFDTGTWTLHGNASYTSKDGPGYMRNEVNLTNGVAGDVGELEYDAGMNKENWTMEAAVDAEDQSGQFRTWFSANLDNPGNAISSSEGWRLEWNWNDDLVNVYHRSGGSWTKIAESATTLRADDYKVKARYWTNDSLVMYIGDEPVLSTTVSAAYSNTAFYVEGKDDSSAGGDRIQVDDVEVTVEKPGTFTSRSYNHSNGINLDRITLTPAVWDDWHKPTGGAAVAGGAKLGDPLTFVEPEKPVKYHMAFRNMSNRKTSIYNSSNMESWTLWKPNVLDMLDNTGLISSGGEYWIYSQGVDTPGVNLSTSPDYTTWTDQGPQIKNAEDPGVINDTRSPSGKCHMLYEDSNHDLAHAYSENCLSFTKDTENNPILDISTGRSGDADTIILRADDSATLFEDEIHMWNDDTDNHPRYNIKHSVMSDFTTIKRMHTDITPDPNGYDNYGTGDADVSYAPAEDSYYLYYEMWNDTTNTGENVKVSYARSPGIWEDTVEVRVLGDTNNNQGDGFEEDTGWTKVTANYTLDGQMDIVNITNLSVDLSSFQTVYATKIKFRLNRGANTHDPEVGGVHVTMSSSNNSAPTISNLSASPDPVNTGETVNVTADITDSDGVDSAKCTLKDADGNIELDSVSMSTTSSDTFFLEHIPTEEPSNIGIWDMTCHANDTEGASSSDTATFDVNDGGLPNAVNIQDNESGYVPVGSALNISADAQDDGAGLDYAVLATNDSGTFRNHTKFKYKGQEYDLLNETSGFTKGNDSRWYIADATNSSVFEYYANWTWTGNRYDISNEDGSPQDLIQESNGHWYVLGASNDNVYEYYHNWTYTGTSHSVVSTFNGPTGLAKGQDGHYYVMEQGGTVYEYNATWDFLDSYGTGSADGSTDENMYQDDTGAWWVVSNHHLVGGESNVRVYKHNASWGYENVSYSLDHITTLDSSASPNDLYLDGDTWYISEGQSDVIGEHTSGRFGSPFQYLSVAQQQKTPWFEWQNSSVNKSFGYKVWVKDDADEWRDSKKANWNVTATGSQYIGDFTPPSFQNLQENSSNAEPQDTVNISTDISDSLSGLTESRLATNESGTFANKTPWSYTGNSYNLGSEHSFSYDTYYNGSHWWTVEPSTDKIHKYEPDWTYTGTNYSTAGETSDPTAILQLSNGNWLLLASTNENVYEYYPNWTYTGTSYDVSSEAGVSEDFVEDENGNFWVVKRTQTTADDGDYVYKYDSSWTYTGTKHSVSSEDTYPTGIAKTGDTWWMMGTDTNSAYRYDNQWTYTGSTYDVSSEDSDPRGFQQWNQSLWLIGDGGDNIYEYSGFLYQSPRLFDNAASELSDHAWKNTSFNGLLGYKIYGKDRAGNWGVSATGTFISTRTPSYTNQKIIRHDIGGSNTRHLNLTINDKGEADIASHNSPPSGSEGKFTNSTLRIDGWTVGMFDWAATVTDKFSRTSSVFDVNFTMSDSRLQEDDYGHDLSTQQVNRSVGIENRGPNAADYDLTFAPEGTTVVNGNTTGTVSGGSTVETTGVWSGDWLSQTEYDFSPQRGEVTLGISYLGDRPFEVANSKAVSFTGVDITGGVTAPRGCSQTNNTAVDVGAATTVNYSVEFSCDPGNVGDPGLVKTLDATDDNQTRYNYTTTELNITSNETRHTNVTWKIDKSELQDWSDRNNQSGSIDSNTTGVTVTDQPNTVRVTFTTDCCSSSPAQGIHTASLVYYVGEEDTTTDSDSGSGGGSGGSSGDDEDDDLGAELLPSTPYRVTPGMNVTETLTVRNYKNVENRVELTIDPRSADACQYVSIREVTKGRVDDAGRIAVNTSGGFGDSGLVRVPPASSGLTGSSSSIPVQLQIRMPDQTTFERVKNENGSLSCRLSATVDRGTVNDVVLEVEPKINPFAWLFDLIGQFTDALLQTFSTTQQTCFGENNTALLTNETAECPETAQETRRMPNRAGAVLIITIFTIGIAGLLYRYR